MIIVTFSNNDMAYDRNVFFQYDYGQKLEIHGLILPDGTLFHFANKGSIAYTVVSKTVNDITTVDVPQRALETPGEMNVYIYSVTDTEAKTLKAFSFNVLPREKPGNYAPPDEPYIIEQLRAELDQIIATGIAEYTPDPEDVKAIIRDYVPVNLITNNDGATVPGTAWDAVRGKAIRDDLQKLLNSITGDVVNDATKISNAAVMYALSQSLKTLNDNLALNMFSVTAAPCITISYQSCYKYGKLIFISGSFMASTYIANADPVLYFPADITAMAGSAGALLTISDTNGKSSTLYTQNGTNIVRTNGTLVSGTYYFSGVLTVN